MTLGDFILEQRRSSNLSLSELSEKTGVSRSSLHRAEGGKYVKSIYQDAEALKRIGTVLGGPFEHMLYLARRCPTCQGMGVVRGLGE
jgi:transcriptional regulator with XRE-family HTH domain